MTIGIKHVFYKLYPHLSIFACLLVHVAYLQHSATLYKVLIPNSQNIKEDYMLLSLSQHTIFKRIQLTHTT